MLKKVFVSLLIVLATLSLIIVYVSLETSTTPQVSSTTIDSYLEGAPPPFASTILSADSTPSGVCAGFMSAVNDDSAFLKFLDDYNIISRTGDLVSVWGCYPAAAIRLNQLLINNQKPKSTELLQAREYLIASTTYCQDLSTAAPRRTQDALLHFMTLVQTYSEKFTPCINSSNPPASETPNITSQAQSLSGTKYFSGHGNDTLSFHAPTNGLYSVAMRYEGDSNFSVWVKDSQGFEMDQITSEIGSVSNKKSEQLVPGNYYLDITASGPWSIQISS